MEEDTICLVVGEEKITCQRKSLTEASEYFRAMFSSNMKESSAKTIEIQDVSVTCLRWLIAHSVENSSSRFEDSAEACRILHTACILQFPQAISTATKYLTSRLSTDNCLQVMCMADLHALNDLYNVARRKALWDFDAVHKTEDFVELSKDDVVAYLGDDLLNCSDERQVLQALLNWMEHDSLNRTPLLEVLDCVRWEEIKHKDLDELLLNPTVEKNESLAEKIKSIVATGNGTQAPCSRRLPRQLWLIGEWSPASAGPAQIVCVHGNLHDNDLRLLDNLPVNCPPSRSAGQSTDRIGFTVTAVGKDLYIFGGGTLNARWSHDCWKYDTFRATWTELGDIPSPRRHHSAVAAGGRYVVLIGGFGKYRVVLDTVQAYDTWTGEWLSYPKLSFAAFSAAACVCNGYVYVIKHHIERCALARPDRWQQLQAALPFEIGPFSAVSVQDKIYLLGKNICTLVCFDTRSLTFDTLATFQPYVQRHWPVLCCKDDRTMFIVSGQDGSEGEDEEEEGELRTVVEEFDLEEKRVVCERKVNWTIGQPQVLTVPFYPKFR